MYCPHCGTRNDSIHKFCLSCGKALPQPAGQPASPDDQEHTVFDIRPTVLGPAIFFLLGLFCCVVLLLAASTLRQPSSGVILLFLAPVMLGGSSLAFVYLAASELIFCFTTRYTLTTHKLTYKAGIVRHSEKTIPVSKIQDVRFSGIGPLGKVIVESAGTTSRITLHGIRNPKLYYQLILRLVKQ